MAIFLLEHYLWLKLFFILQLPTTNIQQHYHLPLNAFLRDASCQVLDEISTLKVKFSKNFWVYKLSLTVFSLVGNCSPSLNALLKFVDMLLRAEAVAPEIGSVVSSVPDE